MRVLWLRCFDMASLHRETTNFVRTLSLSNALICSMTVFRPACPISSIYVLNYTRQVETYVLNCTHVLYWKNMGYKQGFYENGASVHIRCKFFLALFHNSQFLPIKLVYVLILSRYSHFHLCLIQSCLGRISMCYKRETDCSSRACATDWAGRPWPASKVEHPKEEWGVIFIAYWNAGNAKVFKSVVLFIRQLSDHIS